VSDGVSGWNDYGFSSEQFSLQLMSFSKQVLERCIMNGIKNNRGTNLSHHSKSTHNAKGGRNIKKSRSYLSMDNLELDENQSSGSEE